MSLQKESFYEFGPFSLEARARLLLREGEPLPLTPKALETLLMLVENTGQVLDREELIHKLWPDTFVEENNLSVQIFTLRRVLGKAPDGTDYIQTVPRRGYRFTAAVRAPLTVDPEFVVERHTLSRVIVEEREIDTDVDVVTVQPALSTGSTAGLLPAAAIEHSLHKPAYWRRTSSDPRFQDLLRRIGLTNQ